MMECVLMAMSAQERKVRRAESQRKWRARNPEWCKRMRRNPRA